MSTIARCENLTALGFDASLNLGGVGNFSKLLHSSKTLDKLFLVMRDFIDEDGVTMSENKKLIAAASALLEKNTTLTKLLFQGHKKELTSILKGLKATKC